MAEFVIAAWSLAPCVIFFERAHRAHQLQDLPLSDDEAALLRQAIATLQAANIDLPAEAAGLSSGRNPTHGEAQAAARAITRALKSCRGALLQPPPEDASSGGGR